MPRKSGVTPTEVQRWLNRIKYAEHARKQADLKFGYQRALEQYQGDYVSTIPSFIRDVDVVPINEVYAFAKTFIPSVYSRDPFLAVNPKGRKSVAGAKILELAVNAYWRELRLKQQMKRAMLDAIFAEGWFKVGYSAVFGSIAKPEGKPGIEAEEYVKDEEIFATRVSWKNMVRDPNAVNGIHDARYVCERLIKPLVAVRASGIYKNTSSLEPNFVQEHDTALEAKAILQGDEEQFVILWEIWDRDTEEVLVVAEGHDAFLRKDAWPYERMDGFPHCLMRFNDLPDQAYSPNLIVAWEPQLWEKIKMRSMQMDHIKRFSRQMEAEEGSYSRNELEKFRKAETGSIIMRKKGRQAMTPIPYPQVQPDMYTVESRIDLDKDNVSGQPNAVRSAPQRTQSRTLGEIDRLISSFQSRQGEPQDIVEDFCEEVTYKLIAVMQEHLPGEKFIRATQQDMAEIQAAFIDPQTGESRFDGTGFTFSKEDIKGIEFEVEVKCGSTLPMDRQNRMESMVSLLKLGPTIGLNPGDKVTRILGKNLISDFEMKEVEIAYQELIKAMEAQEKVSQMRSMGELDIAGRKIDDLQRRAMSSMVPSGAGGILPGQR